MQRRTERLFVQVETTNNMEEHNFSDSRASRFPVRGALLNQAIRGRLSLNSRQTNVRPDHLNYSEFDTDNRPHGYQSEDFINQQQYFAPPNSSRIHQSSYTAFGAYGNHPETYVNHQSSTPPFNSYVYPGNIHSQFDSGTGKTGDCQREDFNRQFSTPLLSSTSRVHQGYPLRYTSFGGYGHHPETFINHQSSARQFSSHGPHSDQPHSAFDSGPRCYDYQPEDINRQFSTPQLFNSDETYQTPKQVVGMNCEMGSVSDEYLQAEHGKLKFRIIKLYKSLAPSDFSKNSSRFENNEWLKVLCTSTNGLRVYQANMMCPLCYGKVTPQNTEKTPGMSPNWQLFAVKRHLTSLHKEQHDESVAAPASTKEEDQRKDEKPLMHSLETEGGESLNNEITPAEDKIPQTKMVPKDMAILKEDTNSKKRKRADSSSSWSSSSSSSSPSSSSSSSSASSESDSSVVESKTKRNNDQKRGKKYQKKKGVVKPKSGTLRETAEIPDWQKPGVEFQWVKLEKNSKFVPAFLFPLEVGKKGRKVRTISPSGELADTKHEIVEVANPIQVEKAKRYRYSTPYLNGIKKFNEIHKTKF